MCVCVCVCVCVCMYVCVCVAVLTVLSPLQMKIGSTTGFLKSMVDVLLEDAKKQGYEPDASVAGDEVRAGSEG